MPTLQAFLPALRKWWSRWTVRRFIALVVIPSIAGAMLGHGIDLHDITIIVGALSLLGWHLYLVLTEPTL